MIVRYNPHMRTTTISYTDGSSKGNPGPAGWAVLQDGELYSGMLGHTTNNFAEMFAAWQAIDLSPPNSHNRIHTDSRLVIGWLSMGWNMNKLHIAQLASSFWESAHHDCKTYELIWVKGHSTTTENLIADNEALRQAELSRQWFA